MTCIVGLHDKKTGTVYIGGDSAGVDAWHQLQVRGDPKVFRKSGHLFGYTTSFRFGQIVRHDFKAPKISSTAYKDRGRDAHAYDIANEMLRVTKDRKFAKVHDERATGGTLLVAWHGSLYEINDDFQYGKVVRGYAAVGCAGMLALGSLWTTSHADWLDIQPRERVRLALEAAAAHSAGVYKPFKILCTQEPPK